MTPQQQKAKELVEKEKFICPNCNSNQTYLTEFDYVINCLNCKTSIRSFKSRQSVKQEINKLT